MLSVANTYGATAHLSPLLRKAKQLGLPTDGKQQLPKITLEGNKAALYGDVIATLPKTFLFELNQGPTHTAFIPGIETLLVSQCLRLDEDIEIRVVKLPRRL